jgi:hypothetical protein
MGNSVMKRIQRPSNVTKWVCDIAGQQHKEQTGISNIQHFKENYKVDFYRCKSSIIDGITLVRSYIKNTVGRRRFFVDRKACPKFVDAVRRYRYPEKNGIITNENPVKENDDEMDETRYFFVNILNKRNFQKAKVSSFL